MADQPYHLEMFEGYSTKKNVASKLNRYILPAGWEKMEKTRNMIERAKKKYCCFPL